MFHSRPVQFSSVHIMDKNCLPPSEKRCKNFSWSKKAYRLSQVGSFEIGDSDLIICIPRTCFVKSTSCKKSASYLKTQINMIIASCAP